MSKTIVITGANGGLGQALARRFAAEGEQVVLLGRSIDKVRAVAREIGGAAMAVACEVTSPASVREAFARIAERHASIDVLINNAAVFQPFLIAEASDAQIVDAVMINLAGPMLCARSAVAMMGRGGLVINVSSESVNVPFAHLIAYQSTKAGLERFSLGLNDELAERGIRVAIARAGSMVGPGSSAEMEPEAGARFMAASAKRGVNLMERPVTRYASATGVFRQLIDLPADMHVDIVSFQARAAV